MKRLLLLVALIVLVTLVGRVGFSRAQTLSPINNAVSALQASANPTTGAVTELPETVNDGVLCNPHFEDRCGKVIELPATVNGGVQVKPKVYYLSKNSFDGGDAIKACDLGFHMASISEIQDPSNLQYANKSTTASDSLVDDQSKGPPLFHMGWVRSGVYPSSGFVYDCEDFRDKYETQLGTTLALYDLPFNSDTTQPASYPTKGWYTTRYTCSQPEPVWCVEDPE